ncbi:MAG: hypothetical protein GY947_10035, partial [Rhodobacteraceae bacterium]|nr:hypothetical protein [Paracoccaceae bacterium]
LHLWSAFLAPDRKVITWHGIAFLYDLFPLLACTLILRMVQKKAAPALRRGVGFASKVFIVCLGLSLAGYPLLLTDYMGFPVNVFAVDLAVSGFFFSMLFGSSGALAVGFVALTALLLIRFRFQISLPGKPLLYGVLFVCNYSPPDFCI